MIYDLHIFVCTNQRAPGEKRSCGEAHGLDLVAEFKKRLKETAPGLKARINRSGCLGICDYGQTVAVYPEGVFYVGVEKEDVVEILQAHATNAAPVSRLLLSGKDKPPPAAIAGMLMENFAGTLNRELFEIFRDQLRKDIESAGLDADFTGDLKPAMESIRGALRDLISKIAGNGLQISRLLNRVDVSDAQLRRYMENGGGFEEVLPDLIIKRILQKVVLRKKFSS